MTRSGAGNRFRTRKLSTKQSLAVLRENQIDSVDDDAQRNIPQIETGVERQEEIEHHLQAAISASQAAAVGAKVTQIFIPTPTTTEINIPHYEALYPKRFSQPASYIRFSSTVEDCCGPAYCMSAEDEKFLEKMNATKRPGGVQCKVEDFERAMDLFESIAQEKQPYLSMDVSNILAYDEIAVHFNDSLDPDLIKAAAVIYSHWKEQRISRGGRPIVPVLKVGIIAFSKQITPSHKTKNLPKFEQGNEKDDGDPYVCFRRREVRQVRKTRRTDAQSTEKLKKLRQEFDSSRNLVTDVLYRELMRKDSLNFEYAIFEQRRKLLLLKRKLGIRGDDEDLISHKPKKRLPDQSMPPAIRVPMRHDGKPAEPELRQLSATKAEFERQRLEKFLTLKNSRTVPKNGFTFVDLTEEALSSTPEPIPKGPDAGFCGVQTYYLPSPPPSNGPEESLEVIPEESPKRVSVIQVSSRSPPPRDIPAFRRRVGRGGRIVMDRRGHGFAASRDVSDIIIDRMKYDDEDDDYIPIYLRNSNDDAYIQFRARMLSPPPDLPPGNPHGVRRQVVGSPAILTAPGQPGSFVGNGQPQLFNGYKQSPHAQNPVVNGQHQTAPNPQIPASGLNSNHGQFWR